MIGSALKGIAGTPDFDDWEHIKFKQNQLIESESKQIEINTKFQTRLNDVSRALNKILKLERSNIFIQLFWQRIE